MRREIQSNIKYRHHILHKSEDSERFNDLFQNDPSNSLRSPIRIHSRKFGRFNQSLKRHHEAENGKKYLVILCIETQSSRMIINDQKESPFAKQFFVTK